MGNKKYLLIVTSYFLLFLIPFMLFSAVIYNKSIQTLEKEFDESYIERLENAANALDAEFRKIGALVKSIQSESLFFPNWVGKGNDNSLHLKREILQYETSNKLIAGMLLWYKKNPGFVFTSSGIISFETADEKYFEGELIQQLEICNNISGTQLLVWRANNNESVPFTLLYTTRGGSDYGRVVMFRISAYELMNIVAGYLGNYDGVIEIQTNDGSVIASQSRVKNTINIHEKEQEFSIGDKKMKIHAVLSYEENVARMKVQRNSLVKTISIVLLVGLTSTAIISLYNLRQYKQLETSMLEQENQNDTLREQIEQQEGFVLIHTLQTILSKRHSDRSEIDVLLVEHGIKFYYPCFLAIAFRPSNNISKADLKSFECLFKRAYMGDNYFKEFYLLEMILPLHPIGEYVIIVNGEWNEPKYVRELAFVIKELTKQAFKEYAAIGVGEVCYDVYSLRRSLDEACTVLRHLNLLHSGDIEFYSHLKETDHVIWFPCIRLKLLEQNLQRCDLNAFETELDKLVDEIHERNLSDKMVTSICYGLINVIIQAANNLTDVEMGDPGVLLNVEEVQEISKNCMKMLDFDTFDDCIGNIKSVTFGITKLMEKAFSQVELHTKLQYKEIIEHHLSDVGFGLEQFASQLGISDKYLCRNFKKIFGCNFSVYIRKQRMAKVGKLLIDTALPVKDIMEMVGYSDLSNFTRTFRLEMGVPPGEYRNLYRQSSADTDTVGHLYGKLRPRGGEQNSV